MQTLTGVSERDAYDKSLNQLNAPWGELLSDFSTSEQNTQFRCRAHLQDHVATVNLHKATIANVEGPDETTGGQVIIMEDRTSLDTLESELAHSERLASVGRLAAGVAHEIGNPLTGIASIAQNMHQDVSDGQINRNEIDELVREQTDDILTQVGRINSIVRSLLTFSHADSLGDSRMEAVNMQIIIQEAMRLVRLSPDTRRLSFDVNMADNSIVLGDANSLMQVFVNLINNACDASKDGSSVSVVGYHDGNQLVIETTDAGTGIAVNHREQIFEPFFTTKPVGQGTGLGLSLAYSIVSNHGGKLRVGNISSGTRMIVSLPLLSES